MATATLDADDIRRRMAQIRRELHEDVRGVVEGAEAATDWRRYVRSYPWATVGAALVVGYLVVPRRRSTTTIHVAQPGPIDGVVAQAEPIRQVEEKAESRGKKKGLLTAALGMIAPMAFRAAQGYALQFAEQWLAQKMAQQLQDHPGLASAFGGPAGPPPGPTVRPPGAPRF